MVANFVTSLSDFVKLFLRKYFPNAKTIKPRNEINQFIQLERESFWKHFDRFSNLLAECLYHVLDQVRLCQLFIKDLTNKSELC